MTRLARLIIGIKEKNKKGFTIVEVMIIIATVAMLCAFMLPRILTPRIASNEAKARQILKSASGALKAFEIENNLFAYPDDIIAFADKIEPKLDYSDIVSGALSFEESGYWFVYLPGETDSFGNRNTYDFYAVPIVINSTGIHSYGVDEKGVVYIDNGLNSAYVDEKNLPVL